LRATALSAIRPPPPKQKFYVCFDFEENQKKFFEPNIGLKVLNNNGPNGTHSIDRNK
jgi:hypothetical protein